MARKSHWLSAIAEEVRQRALDSVDDIAAGIRDTVPFGQPPPAPPQLHIQDYLSAPPEMRQAMLQGLPPEEFSSTMSRLHSEAVDRFGAAASTILPMISMEQAQGELSFAQAQDPAASLSAAHAELVELLGVDPFA